MNRCEVCGNEYDKNLEIVINKALAEADARRLAGWILGDSGNARIDPALLVAVMATDGSLQAARAANGTLAIGKSGAANAGLLAAMIVATKHPEIREKLRAWRAARKDEVLAQKLP